MVLATNTFVREGGRFRMVHHQAGPTPEGEMGGPDEGEESEEPGGGPPRMLH